MKTPYDVLGVRRNASNKRIRKAFCKAAKACHPDLNAGDPTAEQQFRQVLAAYEILKKPQLRAAYDGYLRSTRRASVRGFALTAVTSVLSGMVVALMVWLLVAPLNTPQTPHIAAEGIAAPGSQQVAVARVSGGRQQGDGGDQNEWGADSANGRLLPDEGPRHLQQSASSPHPTVGHSEPQALLAMEWEQVQASGDAMAIWAFAVRNPDAPESELARSKLVVLIDLAEDVSLLRFLHLVATDAIGERAQQRLNRLGAGAVAREDGVVLGAPSSNSVLSASVGETTKTVNREQPAAQRQRLADWELVRALQAGGFVIVHRYTGRMSGNSPPAPANMIDAGQRLSPEGRVDAEAMGEVYRRLKIPVSEVLSSEYFLVYQTAAVAFGDRVSLHSDLTGSRSFQGPAELKRSLSGLRSRVAKPPPVGTNVVLWTHEGKFKKAFGSALSAGETVVFGRRVDGVPYQVARLSLKEFLGLTD